MSFDAAGQDNYLARFLHTTGQTLLLRTQSMHAYVWPAWLSWAVLMLVDLFVNAGVTANTGRIEIWVLRSVVTTFVVYSIAAHLLNWWMRRGERWDGTGGTMLNLLAATAVAELLPGAVQKFDWPVWVLAIWIYPMIVLIRALTGVGRVSVGYSLAGVLLITIPPVVIRSFGQ
ncbi:hypothetical protein FXN63_00120 [Pigmentiphaga aceris]|uniref:Yip1 domain-containing protein n=1 Tax=Pigmentiphaga aceris TaxID=1940612 RepID=A0A5C0AQW7_9BURK|nr:hypothetical protein [Pigmentiphaga aceris]QEI04418.1 hypothetical protein FXN63_00120 [Pigmentiphaga aceris]